MGETSRMARRRVPCRVPALALSVLLSLVAMAGLGAVAPSVSQAAVRPTVGIAAGGTLQHESVAEQEAYLSAAEDLGATWLRFDFAWTDIQRENSSTYDWRRYDALVARARSHGMQVVGMLAYPPPWARDSRCGGDQTCRPASPSAYATFAGKAAARYATRGVRHWEIWNEPNLVQWFKPQPDPAYYAQMLSSAYTAIHRANPRAMVITGGTAPSDTSGGNLNPVDFVARMYAAGADNHFDSLGHHPYCYAGTFNCPGTQAKWSAWSQMSQTSTSLRSLMADHGDSSKQIWATEFGAPTSGDSTAVSEQQQAAMVSDGVRRFAGYSWAGPMFIYSLKDRGTNRGSKEDWFGVLRADGSRKPSFGMLARALASGTPADSGSGSGDGDGPLDGPNPRGNGNGPSGIGSAVATAAPSASPGPFASPGAGTPTARVEAGPLPFGDDVASVTPWWRRWPVLTVLAVLIGGGLIGGAGTFRKVRGSISSKVGGRHG